MIIRVSRTDRTGRQLDHREAAKRIGRTARYLGSKPTYYVFETPDPTSCAICVTGAGPYSLQQLDEGGPLVAVCGECDQPAREKRGPERGFEPNGGLPTLETARRAARRAMGNDVYDAESARIQAEGRAPATPTSAVDREMNAFAMENKRRIEVNRNSRAPRGRRGR